MARKDWGIVLGLIGMPGAETRTCWVTGAGSASTGVSTSRSPEVVATLPGTDVGRDSEAGVAMRMGAVGTGWRTGGVAALVTGEELTLRTRGLWGVTAGAEGRSEDDASAD